MKKRLLGLLLAVLILSCTLSLGACDDGITDVAYIQFIPAVDGQYVQYTAQMYASSYEHIYLFANEELKDDGDWIDWDRNCLLKIAFNRGFGVDYEIDEKETFVAEIEGWYDMSITIKKEYYDASKRIYLNGVDITSKADSTLTKPPVQASAELGGFWYDAVFYFLDFGLVKGNESNFINTIEYR